MKSILAVFQRESCSMTLSVMIIATALKTSCLAVGCSIFCSTLHLYHNINSNSNISPTQIRQIHRRMDPPKSSAAKPSPTPPKTPDGEGVDGNLSGVMQFDDTLLCDKSLQFSASSLIDALTSPLKMRSNSKLEQIRALQLFPETHVFAQLACQAYLSGDELKKEGVLPKGNYTFSCFFVEEYQRRVWYLN